MVSTMSETFSPDYLSRADLLALGLDPDEADAVLRLSPLTGHGGEPCVEAARLDDLLALLDSDSPADGGPA